MQRTRAVTVVLLVVAILTSPFWLANLVWRARPWRAERVQLVDYSVPYVSGREHQGAVWLLNHEKYRPPTGARWELIGSHAGYDPTDRDHPRPISSLDLSKTDWIYVTDAYGVYEDDLKQIGAEIAHMDYNPKVFGGFSDADAQAISDFSARGKHILLEFNSLEEPTTPAARAQLESLFGVKWTGWTGRTFMNLYDTLDVPRWVPRVFKQQYGHDRMPRGPTLALVHRDGRLRLISDPIPTRVAPRIELTPQGRRTLRNVRDGAAYPNWFPIYRADAATEVLAEFVLPARPAMNAWREEESIPPRIPLLTRRTDGGSHRIYLMADLAETGFPPGRYAFTGLARYRAATQPEISSTIQSPERAFWQFYVPTVRQLLRAPLDAGSRGR